MCLLMTNASVVSQDEALSPGEDPCGVKKEAGGFLCTFFTSSGLLV